MNYQTDYTKRLKDPRWQKRRLEILQRDDFSCVRCEDREKTLMVHHLYYEGGLAPWEYPNWALATVCEDCHAYEHAIDPRRAIQLFKRRGYFASDIEQIAQCFAEIDFPYSSEIITRAIIRLLGKKTTVIDACREYLENLK